MLTPGKVSEGLFWSLIELSPLRSEKVIRALKDFLVLGYTRKEVCEKYEVSYSYFSLALKRIRHVDDVVCQLVQYNKVGICADICER
ncbi:PapB/FocB family fimbrial expression transcriptional regulator [Escherichia coli]|uniref:PapB/FocB family fimbrial expression transcriptional regulator n=1 Tax=Escherichia coli TaxID=562 RepID=UPI000B7E2F8A|nr:PapB/FocB family fimbrial expression transcriptional regulator [Escherichia coli]ELU9693581.1 transcriptional regulator [Escherichia coli]ELU9780681.1 transcriptional regulator [Escherichia coli]MCW7249889.1 adhesin biosynthesis transcription regulatory family protein [Escherichia coli]HAH9220748.1 transcriptional regulator [Escherichia coli]HBB8676975.1 transcriptional regulator [Escherichia coli]